MSTTLAPPTSQPAASASSGSPAELSGAPPGTDFAPLLAAVQQPPGAGANTTTRTADAEGDQAGSDSSAPTQDPDTAAITLPVNTALVLPQVPSPLPAPAAGPASGPARRHGPKPTPAEGSAVATPSLPVPDAASAPNAALLSALAQPSALPSASPASPAAQDPAGVPGSPAGTAAIPVAAQSPQAGPAPVGQAPQTATVPAPQTPATDQGSQTAPPPTQAAGPSTQQQSANSPAAAVAAPPPVAPVPQTMAPASTVAASLAQINDVTSSKGGGARRSRDGAGVAEQPSRLAPAANESSVAQTAAVQDGPGAPDVGATAPGSQPQAQPSVRLAELAQAAQTAISVTSQSGGNAARIVLHPAELGTVQIHLRYSSDGVTATIRADSPQAAQVLHQSAPDLRRALEGKGLLLLDLDVRDQSGFSANDDPAATGGNSGGGMPDAPEDSEAPTSIALDPIYLPAPGSQIDVLA